MKARMFILNVITIAVIIPCGASHAALSKSTKLEKTTLMPLQPAKASRVQSNSLHISPKKTVAAPIKTSPKKAGTSLTVKDTTMHPGAQPHSDKNLTATSTQPKSSNTQTSPPLSWKEKRKDMVKKSKERDKRRINKLYTDMTFDELMISKDIRLEEEDFPVALKYLEHLLKISTDIEKTALLMNEYADLLFEQGELTKASKVYTEFTKLYPGHAQYEYALYKATVCSYYKTLSHDRDQAPTENTLALTQQYLNNKTNLAFHKEVADIEQQCYKKIVQSEIDVCNFYIKQGSYHAAQQRITSLKKDYLTKVHDIEADLLALELKIAEKQERARTVQAKAAQPESLHPAKRF